MPNDGLPMERSLDAWRAVTPHLRHNRTTAPWSRTLVPRTFRPSIRSLVGGAMLIASWPTFAVHPRHLTPVENGPSYVLAEDFVAVEKAATFTLKAGTYLVAFEDERALYLLGGLNCLEMRVVPPKQPDRAYTMPFTCGVYFPKAEAEQARFFVVRGTQPQHREMGLLINFIIQAGEGSFDYPISKKAVVDLRPRLRPSSP